jgi:hypothetical protein
MSKWLKNLEDLKNLIENLETKFFKSKEREKNKKELLLDYNRPCKKC